MHLSHVIYVCVYIYIYIYIYIYMIMNMCNCKSRIECNLFGVLNQQRVITGIAPSSTVVAAEQ